MAIELTPVTRANVRAVCELRVGDARTALVAPAAVTVAEAQYHQPNVLRAIARDGALVGLAWVTMHEPGRAPFLVRLTVGTAQEPNRRAAPQIAL